MTDDTAVASFERASLHALLAKSRGAPYEEALQKIVALKLEQQSPHTEIQLHPHEHIVEPSSSSSSVLLASAMKRRPHSAAPSRSSSPTSSTDYGGGGGRGRSSTRRSQSPSSYSTSSRSTSRTHRGRSGSVSGAPRYLRASSNDNYGYNKGLAARAIAYDDKWGGRSASPPHRPFEPTLMSRASSERILRSNRGNETFQQRVSRSVHNYYIRQAFSCFTNDGPGQYTKQVTLPYHQRHEASDRPRQVQAQAQGAVGGGVDVSFPPTHTFGTERYDDSFMARTFARQSHARDHAARLEPAPGQYAPPNTHSKLFHSREFSHGHGSAHGPGGLHVSTDADGEYSYGPHTGHGPAHSQPSSARGSVRTTYPSPDLSGASPSSRGSRGSSTQHSAALPPQLSLKEQRLRHLLKLISEHS